MQEELRRNNTIGDSQGIIYFAGIVLKSGEIKKSSARQICSFVNDRRINFDSAVAFFEYLGFITSSSNSLIPTEAGKTLYTMLLNIEAFEERLCEECLDKIVVNRVVDIDALRFDATKGKYYILKYGFPIAAAIFRNILIQLRALRERPDGSLELRGCYEALFARVQKKAKRILSLESLKQKLKQQEEQGEAAEVYVVKYEVLRIANDHLSRKVKRISEIDVSAGYDIVSFENSKSLNYDRYIEVKSFSGQPHFYWSKNEIEMAERYGDRYYLYLVNIEKMTHSNYSPMIIQNPVKTIIYSENWLMQPTSYLILPTDGEEVSVL